jgi:hypothetical protein
MKVLLLLVGACVLAAALGYPPVTVNYPYEVGFPCDARGLRPTPVHWWILGGITTHTDSRPMCVVVNGVWRTWRTLRALQPRAG